MAVRKLIVIDESKCDGCGLCATACHEGAIQIVDGKAKLISESYCDGLGDCIGECPRDAITIVEREGAAYDQAAVDAHLARVAVEKRQQQPKPRAARVPVPPSRLSNPRSSLTATPPTDLRVSRSGRFS